MEGEDAFLGIGWGFPPTFDRVSSTTRMVSDAEDIAQSLRLILETSYGERVMRPDFGSNLSMINFKAVDGNTINELKSYVEQAVLQFEPRVTLERVDIDASDIYDGVLHVKLEYIIRKINVRTNIVFPFYFKEGTNVSGM